MLRTRPVVVAGQKFTVGNLTLGAQRRFNEGLARIQADPRKAIEDGVTLQDLFQDVILSSLRRADPAVTVEALDPLDLDDLRGLFREVTAWTGDSKGDAPAGELPSP
jgi:hypothetical protein